MVKNSLKNQLFFIVLLIVFLYLIIFITKIGDRTFARTIMAKFAETGINCSDSAPDWMPQLLQHIIHDDDILSNQLMYIDQQGNKYHCISGSPAFGAKRIQHNTRFKYASLTKVFTHHAILDLAKQKKINLEENFIQYFPELSNFKDPRIQKIKVIDLLQHRSGFDHKKNQDPFFDLYQSSWCPYNIQYLKDIVLDFNPDARYSYDNRNSCLLGVLIERVTGDPFREFLIRHYSLNEYKIKFSNGKSFSDEVDYDYSNSYFLNEKFIQKMDFYALSAVGGLTGSAENLAILVKNMLNNSVLDIFSISEYAAKQCRLNDFETCNGVVFRSYQKSQHLPKMYYRVGSLGPATSLLAVTDQKEVIVWVGNGLNIRMDEHFIDQYLYKHLIQK